MSLTRRMTSASTTVASGPPSIRFPCDETARRSTGWLLAATVPDGPRLGPRQESEPGVKQVKTEESRTRYFATARLRRVFAATTGAGVCEGARTTREDTNVRSPCASKLMRVWYSFTLTMVPSPYVLCETRSPAVYPVIKALLLESRPRTMCPPLARYCTRFAPASQNAGDERKGAISASWLAISAARRGPRRRRNRPRPT